MDLNYLLLWFIGASCVLLFYRTVRVRRAGWAAVCAFVLAATGVATALRPATGGYVGGAAMALLILVPLFGYRRALRAMLRQRYGTARRLVAVLRWLHPADGWWQTPRLLRALESGDAATIAATTDALSHHGTSRTGIGRLAAALLFRLNGQWDALLRWIEANLSSKELRRDPTMLALYLRCHGELGDPNGLAAAYGRLRRAVEGEGMGLHRDTCRLMLFAFAGRRGLVERLLRGPLRLYPEPVQRAWLATADMARGRAEPARDALNAVLASCDPLTAAAVRHRLAVTLPVAEQVLTAEARDVLAHAEAELGQEERYGVMAAAGRRTAYAAYTLVALNLVAFGLEVASGGSESLPALYKLGALLPTDVLAGEWWRLAAANFLHYGPVHLGVNMLALLLLGPFLEFALGWARFLVAYLASGVGTMAVIVALVAGGVLEDQILVGASGCIMGLVGATTAVLVRGWARERARVASRRLAMLLFIIGFQVVFDLATPQVSFSAHLGGVLLGFAAASLMRHRLAPARA